VQALTFDAAAGVPPVIGDPHTYMRNRLSLPQLKRVHFLAMGELRKTNNSDWYRNTLKEVRTTTHTHAHR